MWGIPIWLLLAVLAAAAYAGYRWWKNRKAEKANKAYTNVFPNTALDFTERDNPKVGGKG